jgi:hypothetical protein
VVAVCGFAPGNECGGGNEENKFVLHARGSYFATSILQVSMRGADVLALLFFLKRIKQEAGIHRAIVAVFAFPDAA